MSGLSRLSIFAAMLLTAAACSSSPPLQGIPSLPKELPPDLQARFEVVDVSTPEPAKAKRIAKKNKTTKAPAPFVYPSRRPKNMPIWVGEQQVLETTYIGIKAGEFTLDVLPLKKIGGRSVYNFHAHALSSAMMNLFYRVNDSIDSFWDYEGLFSHRYHMVLDQTKQTRDALELYDSEKKKDFYWNRRNHVDKGNSETKETFDMEQPFSQDSFSALYYLRTLPLETGQVYDYPVISEGKGWECVVTVLRRESCDTPMGKKTCIVVRPQTRYNGALKQEKGETYIWLTDDDRRFIVRLEAEVKIGAVAARLTHVELGERPNGE